MRESPKDGVQHVADLQKADGAETGIRKKKQAHFWVCQPLLLGVAAASVGRLCRGAKAALESKEDCLSAILTLVTTRLLVFS